jgi:two-component system cell cycle sensor histidine kinase/response regulator CckA
MVEQGHPAPESGSETVLLVDDDPSILALCRKKLEEQGFKVLQASESPEALETCSRHSGPIHLLLTDLLLPPKKLQLAAGSSKFPRMHGVELMRRAMKMRPDIRVILMSAHSDDVLKGYGIKRKEQWPFLRKPFNPDTLVRLVREVIAGPPIPLAPERKDKGKGGNHKDEEEADWYG